MKETNEEMSFYCCEKMYEVLHFESSTFRRAKPNLISVYAGNTEMRTPKEIQAAIKIARDQNKKEIRDKKVVVGKKPSDKEVADQIAKHKIIDKITKIQMTEIISFCPFCGEKLME